MPRSGGKLDFDNIRRILKDKSGALYFIGIGGVSMYTLARVAQNMGHRVFGSDRVIGFRTRDLVSRGITVYIGHDSSHIHGASLVVYSHAISEKNPEMLAAKNLGIPLVSRAELLGAMMLSYKNRIGVSGTHGKSTTVAMLDSIFSSVLSEPTTLSGADLEIGEPLRIGGDNLLLYEACEYKDSFLHFSPTIAIGLNLELDHTDYFSDISALSKSFKKALGRASECTVINLDDEHLSEIMPELRCRVVTFGQGERAEYRYRITSFLDNGYEVDLYHGAKKLVKIRLSVIGVHNVTNAVAAIVAAIEYGIDPIAAASALEYFGGISRRLELVGRRMGRPVYYDYAHHPTEIAAGINAIKMQTHDFVTVVFKPHTFSRTASLWSEFSAALSLADHIILTDIYPAREEPIAGVNSRRLAADIGERAIFSPDYEVLPVLDNHTHGAIIIMGAGEMEHIKNEIVEIEDSRRI